MKFRTSAEVTGFKYSNDRIVSVLTKGDHLPLISLSEVPITIILIKLSVLQNTEIHPRILGQTQDAPSSLLYYLGIKGEVPNVLHHNLFLTMSWTSMRMRFILILNGQRNLFSMRVLLQKQMQV